MPNPLEQCIASASQTDSRLRELMLFIGNNSNPNGKIMVAYRNARRALRTALNDPNPKLAVQEAMSQLRDAVDLYTRQTLDQARSGGAGNALEQLSFYGIEQTAPYTPDPTSYEAAIAAVLSLLDAQVNSIYGLVELGGEEPLIVGDDAHPGQLNPTNIVTAGAFWVTELWQYSFEETILAVLDATSMELLAGMNIGLSQGLSTKFLKQAIAALDERTTDCCLRVHGQIQPLNKPFKLTGYPRYADELDGPPFHPWCRTSTVLYLPQYDEGLTPAMRDSAQIVLSERAAGLNKVRHPADAFAN